MIYKIQLWQAKEIKISELFSTSTKSVKASELDKEHTLVDTFDVDAREYDGKQNHETWLKLSHNNACEYVFIQTQHVDEAPDFPYRSTSVGDKMLFVDDEGKPIACYQVASFGFDRIELD